MSAGRLVRGDGRAAPWVWDIAMVTVYGRILSFSERSVVNLLYHVYCPRVSKVCEDASKKPLQDHVKNLVLDIIASDKDDNDAEVPYIKYHFRD